MPNKLIVNGELVLYGPVGLIDFWDDAGFTAGAVITALEELSGDIIVRLNSAGGIAPEGVAIYHLLKRHEGKVTVVVDALALSAASVIAMAGDEIIMPEGTMMMVHDPATITIGNADDHRRTADYLDTAADAYSTIYAAKTGKGEAEIRSLMKAETWMDGEQAVAMGFATSTAPSEVADEPVFASADPTFDFSTYRNAPAPLMALATNRKASGLPMVAVLSAPSSPPKGKTMTKATTADPNTASATVETPPAPVTAAAPQAAPVMDAAAIRAEAQTAERQRIAGIRSGARAAGITDDAFVDTMIEGGKTVMEAKASFIDYLADKNTAPGPQLNAVPARVGQEESEKFVQGATLALQHRAKMDGGEHNEFSGLTLAELARMSLDRRNIKSGGMSKMLMVGTAFAPFMAGGMHSTSDFGNVLANVANKSMAMGFTEAPETFPQWTRAGTLPDFKSASRVGMGVFSSLRKVSEGAEYKYITVGDYAEPIILATYGELFAITRQAIINDDMDAFTRIPRMMGRAASRTIGDLVYAVLTDNPAMSDSKALFHADHKNLNTTGTALALATLSSGRAAMRKQKTRDGKATINVAPAFLLTPVALGDTARQLMGSQFDITKSNNVPNPVQGMAKVIDEPRLDENSSTAWYLAADPSSADTIEVAYLDGQQAPTLEQQDGWSIDGTEFKVRIDAGVSPLAWQGLQKNTGASS